jgi:hypothetical protein
MSIPQTSIHTLQLLVELALLLHHLPQKSIDLLHVEAHLAYNAQEALKSDDLAEPCCGLYLLYYLLTIGGRTYGGRT